ncbi:MAG: hypothetical protein CHACPFDD_03257 [Phycisphaerae bacterium]|nr:hypothetical protein [Phycisphaerae bacterium]
MATQVHFRRSATAPRLFAAAFAWLLIVATPSFAADGKPFRIAVVDAATNRGVPLVELTTVNGVTYVTDSAGMIAFDEPGLMNQEVFFAIRSHGYTHPKDGFGNAGVRLTPTEGGAATVRIERVNIATRLYRLTGQGIYRDSVLLGDTPPTAEPLLNGGVLGQDSVQRALYRGKIYWFWGDTARASYPLGNFAMSGATSELPSPRGNGLDPAKGVDYRYFTGSDGFSRPMCPIEGQPGPVWCDGMTTIADKSGRERLLCHFARMKSLGEMYEQGIALYNDERELFEPIKRIPLDALLFMRGNPLRVKDEGGDYYYFATPLPLVRCRADYDALLDPGQYEAYTCLEAGARYDISNPRLERREGRLVYGWKRDTALVQQKEQKELIDKGHMRPEEALIRLADAASGKTVLAHAGTVAWNAYCGAWLMVFQEGWGSSMCGESWLATAPRLTGPWEKATKIITHVDYSFYNVSHHPFFDQDGGRVIYLEGTYTMTFSGTKVPTPRYDYNQIMYAVDLSDPRLGNTASRSGR